jgi:hypothetical protein
VLTFGREVGESFEENEDDGDDEEKDCDEGVITILFSEDCCLTSSF